MVEGVGIICGGAAKALLVCLKQVIVRLGETAKGDQRSGRDND
jgi:hypothetical protein